MSQTQDSKQPQPHIPYDPVAQQKADEESLARDAVKGIFFLAVIAVSVWVGTVYGSHSEDIYNTSHLPIVSATEVREDSPNFRFINPILFTDDDKTNFPEFKSFDSKLDSYISSVEKKPSVDSVSVYFRDLNSGHWTGINEDDNYEPANMLEVIIMMGYFKKASSDPSVLSEQIYYQASPVSTTTQFYPPTKILPTGFYSAEQLIEHMIRCSDLTAEKALTDANPEYGAVVYHDFQLPQSTPQPASQLADFMSARQYSTLFRALYNSTYLPWDLSEKAMQLLSMTHWNRGVVAGLHASIADDTDGVGVNAANATDTDGQSIIAHDQDLDATDATAVAHKFGEHTSQLADDTIVSRELHDCGVVYAPGRPYLLCVMTKGKDFPTLAGVISTISRLTYTYVDGR